MKNKIETLQSILKEDESLLIDSSFDVLNLLVLKQSFNSNEYDMNLLISKKQVYLICEPLFYPFVKQLKKIKIIKADKTKYLESSKLFLYEIRLLLKKEKTIKLGLINPSLSHFFNNYSIFNFVSPSKTLSIIKTDNEIKLFKKAGKILNEILSEIPELLNTGMTDIELRNIIDLKIYELGGERRYVPTLVGFDAKTIYPTLINKKLRKGQIVLVDFGIMLQGIGISVSRSFAFGKLTKYKECIFQLSFTGIELLRSIIKPGIRICDIDAEIREFYNAHNLKNVFCDYCIKLPGTSYFEYVNSIKDKTILRKNMIVKTSSSLFVPGKFGIRNEEIIIIKKRREKIV